MVLGSRDCRPSGENVTPCQTRMQGFLIAGLEPAGAPMRIVTVDYFYAGRGLPFQRSSRSAYLGLIQIVASFQDLSRKVWRSFAYR